MPPYGWFWNIIGLLVALVVIVFLLRLLGANV